MWPENVSRSMNACRAESMARWERADRAPNAQTPFTIWLPTGQLVWKEKKSAFTAPMTRCPTVSFAAACTVVFVRLSGL
jgi:hypothetical protein